MVVLVVVPQLSELALAPCEDITFLAHSDTVPVARHNVHDLVQSRDEGWKVPGQPIALAQLPVCVLVTTR